MNFEIIREARKSLHMTQAELADKLEVNRATISKYETGEIPPSLKQFEKLAEVLGIPVEDLLRQEGREMSIGENIHKTPGQFIKAARIKAGLTQRELGEKMGLAYQTVAQWENDLRKPKIETLKRIAEALGADFYSLADTEEEPRPAGDPLRRITEACEKLTDAGREKAAEIVEIIAGNPEYRRKAEDDITTIILEGR